MWGPSSQSDPQLAAPEILFLHLEGCLGQHVRRRGSRLTWVKRSRALCRLACMPVGGSLVILMAFSRMPWGMMWDSGLGAGSALMNTR